MVSLPSDFALFDNWSKVIIFCLATELTKVMVLSKLAPTLMASPKPSSKPVPAAAPIDDKLFMADRLALVTFLASW